MKSNIDVSKSTKTYIKPMFMLGMLSVALSVQAMQPLDDQTLSEETGQAAFFTNYVGTGGTNPNPGIGFFTLGINATVQLNANISHLQLGCGGVKGLGCDIDIDQLSVVGVAPVGGTYAGTDAQLNNPFLMLAIKNPTSLSTRQVVGINLGAQSALGTLLTGQNLNTGGALNANNNTGINTLSGNLGVSLQNATFTNVCATVFGICTLFGSANVASYSQDITLNRQSTVPDLGPMTAQASGGLLGLTLSDVHLMNEPLIAIHAIVLKNPDGTPMNNVSLSLQNQNIIYPITSSTGAQSFATTGPSSLPAQTGWWLNLPSVTMDNLVSNQQVKVNAISGIFNARVNITPVDLGQYPAPNCYGSLKFC